MDPVAICNMALGYIGANKIESIDADAADSTEAELCSSFYGPTVLACLEEQGWLFATDPSPVDLGAPAVNGLDTQFPVKFVLDPAIVAVRRCDDGSGDFTIKWERRNGFVVSEDTPTLYAIVTRYNEDPATWTPTFRRAVAYLLASDLAIPLAHNKALSDRMLANHEREIKKAGVYDGMQGTTNEVLSRKSSSLAGRR